MYEVLIPSMVGGMAQQGPSACRSRSFWSLVPSGCPSLLVQCNFLPAVVSQILLCNYIDERCYWCVRELDGVTPIFYQHLQIRLEMHLPLVE